MLVDFNLENGYPLQNEEEALILQQIEILFDTTPGEILGDINYGTKYSDFLYNLQTSNEDIRRTIMSDLYTLETFEYNYDVKVDILKGSENDIILVQIFFQKEDSYFEVPFKIVK